jgi:hypothetical protein
MTITAVKPQVKAPASPAVGQGARPVPPPAAPSRRSKVTPLTPLRVQAAKSMSKLADSVQHDHPDLTVHEHVRDAARMLRAGNEEASQRHLRAAMFALTPQSLMRNGQHTDDAHLAARQAVHGVHRHLLLVKDIADVAAKNQQALMRDSYGDGAADMKQPDPNAGYGPGANAQKPTARQPGGDKALNAPDRTGGGGPDLNVAEPKLKMSKQFTRNGAVAVTELAYGWGDLSRAIALTGDGHGHHVAGTPDVYSHGWNPADGTEMDAKDIRRPGKGGKAARTVATGKPASPGGSGGILSGPHPADRLTVAANPGTTAKAMSDADLKAADKELSRRAAMLGKPGQLSRAHKAVAAETRRRKTKALAYGWNDLGALIELSAETGRLASTPAPDGKPGGPGLYGVKGLGHSAYFENVRNGLMKRGMDEGKASAMTWGILRRWAAGGGKVHPEVKAAAAKAITEEEAKAHAHSVTWDDHAAVIGLTGDANHHHIPGSPLEWEHGYDPISAAAASSHFRGKTPAGWKPKSGGKADGPQHLKFTDGSGKVSYHTVHDQETAGKIRAQATARGMTAAEGDKAKDPGVAGMPKNARALHDAAHAAGWNVSHYPGSSSDVKFDDKGHEIPGSGTQIHAITAHNPVTGKTVRQSWTGSKVAAHPQGESLSASIAAIKAHPVSAGDLKALGTPAGKQRRQASRIGEDATEFSARGGGTNAQKVGYEMHQASQALHTGDRQTAIRHLLTARSASTVGHEVFARGTGYAATVITKHLEALGNHNPQLATSWDDHADALELAIVRVPAGSAGGGQFGSGGGAPVAQQPNANAARAQQKAALLLAAKNDRMKAAALMGQRRVLAAALASASGKVKKAQAGAKTKAAASKTATTAPPVTSAAGIAKATATAKAAAAPKKLSKKAQLTAQVATLTTQIAGLLAQASAATAQAAKL